MTHCHPRPLPHRMCTPQFRLSTHLSASAFTWTEGRARRRRGYFDGPCRWRAGRACAGTLSAGFGVEERRNLERETGIEPATNGLGSRYSTIELLPPSTLHYIHSGMIMDTFRACRRGEILEDGRQIGRFCARDDMRGPM